MKLFSTSRLFSLLFSFFLCQVNLGVLADTNEVQEDELSFTDIEDTYEEEFEEEEEWELASQVVLKANDGFLVPIVVSLIGLAVAGKLSKSNRKAFVAILLMDIVFSLISRKVNIGDLLTSTLLFSAAHCFGFVFIQSEGGLPKFNIALLDNIITYFLGSFFLFFFLKLIFMKKEGATAASLLLQTLLPTMLRVMVAGFPVASIFYWDDLQKWEKPTMMIKFLMTSAGISLFVRLMFYYYHDYLLYNSLLEDVVTYAIAGIGTIFVLTVITDCDLANKKVFLVVIPCIVYVTLIFVFNLIDDEGNTKLSFDEIDWNNVMLGATSTFLGLLAMLYYARCFTKKKKEDGLLNIGNVLSSFLLIMALSTLLFIVLEAYLGVFLQGEYTQYFVVVFMISLISSLGMHYSLLKTVMKNLPSLDKETIYCYVIFTMISLLSVIIGAYIIRHSYIDEITFHDLSHDCLCILITIFTSVCLLLMTTAYENRSIKGFIFYLGIVLAVCLSLGINYYWQVFVLNWVRNNSTLEAYEDLIHNIGFFAFTIGIFYIFIDNGIFWRIVFTILLLLSSSFTKMITFLFNVLVLDLLISAKNDEDMLS